MRARRPDLIVAEVPDRGHVPFLDEPEAQAALAALLARVARVTDIAAIRAAAARARGIRRTPLLAAAALDRLAGRRVLVKAECLQVTGSFKARGAWAAISALAPAERGARRPRLLLGQPRPGHRLGRRGAWRAGGHPDALGRALGEDRRHPRPRRRGRPLRPRRPRTATRSAPRLAAERGLTLVPPFDDPEVIAGQGTTGLEIAAQAAEEGVARADVLVCCGGGGLSAGIALALEAEAPGLRVRPAEPAGFDDMARSLAAGERLGNASTSGSVCDAILTPRPGELTFPVLQPPRRPRLRRHRRGGARRRGARLPPPPHRARARRCGLPRRRALPPRRHRRRRGHLRRLGRQRRPRPLRPRHRRGVRRDAPPSSCFKYAFCRCGPRAAADAQGRSGPSRKSALSAIPGVAPGKAALKNSAIFPEA